MKKLKILAIICVLVMTTNVHAALQSRPGVEIKDSTSYSTWFKNIREMETSEGTLGLNAIFAENASTGEWEETTISNNIDVHMCKNTEWGAVAMLSASPYGAGNGKVVHDYNNTTRIYGVKASTTGNVTGIYGMNGNRPNTGGLMEIVSAGIIDAMPNGYNHKYIKNASIRYVDKYANGDNKLDFSRYIAGDATYETKSFAGGGGYFPYSNTTIIGRGFYGMFYTNNEILGNEGRYMQARACVWVGNGI